MVGETNQLSTLAQDLLDRHTTAERVQNALSSDSSIDHRMSWLHAENAAEASSKTLAEHLGVDHIHYESPQRVTIYKHINPLETESLELPLSDFTVERLKQYRDHPVLEDSPIWESPEFKPARAQPAFAAPANSVVENAAPKVEILPPENAAKEVENTTREAGSWLNKLHKMHPVGKAALIGGAAAVIGSVGYWALKDKERKDPSKPQETQR